MEVKITTLAENTALANYIGEWGLSMLVEADGVKILFDTGMGTAAVHNAGILNVDFNTIDKMVLSHGHYDHTGGLLGVLQRRRQPVEIIAHPDIWTLKYGKAGGGPAHYAGMPFRREQLEALGAQFNLTAEPVKISEHITTLGEIPMVTEYEQIDAGLFDKTGGELLPDKLKDDLGMVVDTDFGLVVILGCSHRGIVNSVKHACKITGKDRVYAAIGGTHLLNADIGRWAQTAADLKEMGLQYLAASHCTGFSASAFLAQEFGENFFLNNAGSRWKLPF